MIEEVVQNVFRTEIPIPDNPLGSTNSYLVKGPERNLMIDTGLNQEESIAAMKDSLRKLEVDLTRTDFFITHLHPDHFGLVSSLAMEDSKVYLHQWEMDWFNVTNRLAHFLSFAKLHGFTDQELKLAAHQSRVFECSLKRNLRFHFLKEHDTINVGDMSFRCVETPGHTRGHLCLFEPDSKIFLSGDHILSSISPVIEFMRIVGWEPLKGYLSSLDKVERLDIELVLPGHGKLFRGHRDRIQELKVHHARRLEEVASLLKDGNKTAFQLASLMTWNINYDLWALFPLFQKIIAVGETVAHLAYLESEGRVNRQAMEDHIVYSLNNLYGTGTL